MFKVPLLIQIIVAMVIGLSSAAHVQAVTFAGLEFADQAQEQRYIDLITELRCLVCQNQSLADSDADLAQDLRAEVYEMMQQGKENSEITDFLVSRYGDFVLYRPPVKSSTLLLWFTPIAFILIAIIALVRNLSANKPNAQTSLDSNEQAQLSALLSNSNSDPESGDRNKDNHK